MVNGSVRIIKAKNSSGEEASVRCTAAPTLAPPTTLKIIIVASAAAMKLSTRPNFLILRTSSSPPTSTNGSMVASPTHQLADWLIVKYVSATAKAAGLNRCFLLIARMYFEAIAHTAAQPRNHMSWLD